LILLILVAREGFLKHKCGPRAKTFERHWHKPSGYNGNYTHSSEIQHHI